MKFQILFLSILTATHARYEPKGPRLRGGDDRDLELVLVSHWDDWENKQLDKQTTLSKGDSATVQCDIGECCLKKGDFEDESSVLHFPHYAIGVMGCERSIRYSGSLGECTSEQGCVISCHGYSSYLPDEFCEVKVQAGSVGGNDGKDSSSGQPLLPPTPFSQPQPSRTIPIPPNSGGNTSAMKTTRVAEGDSATFECGSGSHCRVTPNSFSQHDEREKIVNGISKYHGSASNCLKMQCVISCDEGCVVNVQDGSVGGNDGTDSSSRQPLLPPTPFSQPQPSPSRPIPPFLPHNSGESTAGKKNDSVIDRGQSVTIQCSSDPWRWHQPASRCCVKGNFRSTYDNEQPISLGHDLTIISCSGSGIITTISGGSMTDCLDKQCLISCDEGCTHTVQEATRTIPVAPPTSSGTTVVAMFLAVPLLHVTLLLALI